MNSEPLEVTFPGLAGTVYVPTSPFDPNYNCIAWAAGDNTRWWEPDPWGIYYWPEEAPREFTVAAFKAAFATLGYTDCQTDDYQATQEKVALFCKNGTPTHASRQIDAQFWTSKLGKDIDMSHELEAVSGAFYGSVNQLLARSK